MKSFIIFTDRKFDFGSAIGQASGCARGRGGLLSNPTLLRLSVIENRSEQPCQDDLMRPFHIVEMELTSIDGRMDPTRSRLHQLANAAGSECSLLKHGEIVTRVKATDVPVDPFAITLGYVPIESSPHLLAKSILGIMVSCGRMSLLQLVDKVVEKPSKAALFIHVSPRSLVDDEIPVASNVR